MLTTDGILSFAVMNYANIGLEENEFYAYGIVGDVGVRSYITNRRYLHQNGTIPAIVHIADETGNTGQLGQWVFRTDDLSATTSATTTTTGSPTAGLQPHVQIIIMTLHSC